MTEQFLPVGIQDFQWMITGNFVYVDKTRYIHQMVRPPQGFYFFARPRRFGKSLTVSTLDYLFQGRRDLFEGLYIAGTGWEWKNHPVVKIDFNQINSENPEMLKESLLNAVYALSEKHGIDQKMRSLPDCFSRLIIRLSEIMRESVVVLIDEYDKPIINHLGGGEKAISIAKQNRDILKQVFGVLKGGDISAALRFVFITGISKFARVSIFSDLNNLNDISMQDKYDAMLGYTFDELKSQFARYIGELSEKKGVAAEDLLETISIWYNGYRFAETETTVFNPFSVLKLFDSGKVNNYWFETATPTFLMNLIKQKDYPVADIENLRLPKDLISVYELDHLQLEPLLFQTGYITIDRFEDDLYHMAYPNQEVKTSFLSCLMNDFAGPEKARLSAVYRQLHRHLKEMKMEDFIDGVRTVLGSIPYSQIAGKTDEAYYPTVFYLMLSASGAAVQSEVLSSRGRMDMVVEFEDKVYIIELKCDQSSDKAIQQILEKRYYEKFLGTGRTIYLMGVDFDTGKRTIEDWQCKDLVEFTPDQRP